jgi:hypothetical protein
MLHVLTIPSKKKTADTFRCQRFFNINQDD